MNTAAPTFRCRFCEQATEPNSVLPVACTSCLLAQAPRGPLEVPPRRDVPPPTTATVPTDSTVKLFTDPPDGLLAELAETNGDQPVTPALARLVWMLGDLPIDAQDELADIAEVLKPHNDLDAFDRVPGVSRTLCQAVQSAVHAAAERQAVTGVLTGAGFYPSGQSLPDVVQEVVALAGDGEDAYALLLEADFITESHRVQDARRSALAAAAETTRALHEMQWSYELQTQCMKDLAVTARRVLISAHTVGGHSGEIHVCPDCVSDAIRISMFGGLSI